MTLAFTVTLTDEALEDLHRLENLAFGATGCAVLFGVLGQAVVSGVVRHQREDDYGP